MLPRLILPLVALALPGCATTISHRPSKPAFEFPSRASLDAIPDVAPPAGALESEGLAVDTWAPSETPPVAGADVGDAGRWGEILQSSNARSARYSPELACAAREIGRFSLRTGKIPATGLRHFLAARCGVTMPSVEYAPLWRPGARQGQRRADL